MAFNYSGVEEHLWKAADELHTSSKLKFLVYAVPVLGLTFLRYADAKFTVIERKLIGAFRRASSRPV